MAQYSRCGCQTECPCVLIGGKGIEVTGTGNVDDPYIISTDGTIDCGAIMGCVCSKINGNTGIRCNGNQQIELFLSGDGGNGMKFGQDGGLYASCPNCMDNPNNCVRSVDDLDAKITAKQFLWGTFQGGRLVVPWGTLRSVEHAVDIQSDLDIQWCSSLRGCSAAIYPYDRFCGSSWTAHYQYAQASPTYCNSIDYYRLSPAQWMNFTKDVDWYYNDGWENRLADGGRTLSQLYGRTNGKLINGLFLGNTAGYAAITSTIRYWCMQRRTIIFHWDPTAIPEAVGAGIPAGISVFSCPKGDDPWSCNFTPDLAARAKAAGADWAAVSLRLPDDQISTFPAAGLKTFGFDTFRRTDAHRATQLGLVGLVSDDMVYQRYEEVLNPLPGYIPNPNRGCFFPVNHSTWGVGSAGHGQLFPPENPDGFRTKRGYFNVAREPTNLVNGIYLPCWHLPAGFGDYSTGAQTTDDIPSMLVGDISSHAYFKNPTGYRISFYAGWVDSTNSNYSKNPSIMPPYAPGSPNSVDDKYGMFFGAPDDRNISGPNAFRDKGPAKAAQGYGCFIRPTNGQLVTGMRSANDGDPRTGYKQLAASTAPGAVPANQLWWFNITVVPNRIVFAAQRPNQSAYFVDFQGPDAGRFRGGYLYLMKEELTANRFECRWAEVHLDALNAAGVASGNPVQIPLNPAP